ncbi:hypothetical protein [Cyclobacterium roseum]|uniref:hypothetical protein n=1 Tax=Cyclobacterium roseum TaxID=2666137 RepID=UPI0013914DF8|nr:hypothetical protein [Cyclobacterium roseum]
MEKLKELSLEELKVINGGEPVSIAIGLFALAIAVGSVGVYLYNNSGDIARGFRDGRKGNYNPPLSCR